MLFIVKRILDTKTDEELAHYWNQINCFDWPDVFPDLPEVWSGKTWQENRVAYKLANATRKLIEIKLGDHYLISKDWHTNWLNRTEDEFELWWNSKDNPFRNLKF